MSICLSGILQVGDGGEQKPRRHLSLVGMWLGISKKVALQKPRDPEASVLLGGARFVTRSSPEHRPAPLQAPTPAPSVAQVQIYRGKGGCTECTFAEDNVPASGKQQGKKLSDLVALPGPS